MSLPKVSICMPVYNGGNYFRQALASALAQDYDNMEIVVVNDGSTDDGETERIAQGYGNRVRYVAQQNRGVAGALNTAIAHMTGDYFAWLSHDDLHLPHKTTRQIEYLHRLGRADACLFSDYKLIGPTDETIADVCLPKAEIRKNPQLPLLNGMINGCTLLIPAWIMREFGPFDEQQRYTQDYDLWNRILARHEFFHQAEILVHYRIHPGQDSHKPLAVTEGDALWRRMLDSRSETERVQLFGSTPLYFRQLAQFLNKTPYDKAAAYAHARAASSRQEALVSIILPFWNEAALARRAAQSALDQLGVSLELILVDDGSNEDIGPITALAEADARVKLVRQRNAGPAAARNRGVLGARGQYIAFLDADDRFLPNKLARQLDLMQRHGALFSHTSYYVEYPGVEEGWGLMRSGAYSGACYPDILRCCQIATPTVMLHRSIVDAGFAFNSAIRIGEDVLSWIDIAARFLVLGIDEPLSVVEWSESSAALSIDKQIQALSGMLAVLESNPLHGRFPTRIAELRAAMRYQERERRKAMQHTTTPASSPAVELAWQNHPDVPLGAHGRAPGVRAQP